MFVFGRNDLWPESKKDLHIVFMESAIKMGGRNPLRPQQKEGVVTYIGSTVAFSGRLEELQEEVRPLYKIASCTYKRTSVQTIFENAGFKVDWCAFRIVGNNRILGDGDGNVLATDNMAETPHGSEKSIGLMPTMMNDRWEPMARDEVPKRNYIDELAFAIAIPGMLLTVLIAILSAVLCFYHDKM